MKPDVIPLVPQHMSILHFPMKDVALLSPHTECHVYNPIRQSSIHMHSSSLYHDAHYIHIDCIRVESVIKDSFWNEFDHV